MLETYEMFEMYRSKQKKWYLCFKMKTNRQYIWFETSFIVFTFGFKRRRWYDVWFDIRNCPFFHTKIFVLCLFVVKGFIRSNCDQTS